MAIVVDILKERKGSRWRTLVAHLLWEQDLRRSHPHTQTAKLNSGSFNSTLRIAGQRDRSDYFLILFRQHDDQSCGRI